MWRRFFWFAQAKKVLALIDANGGEDSGAEMQVRHPSLQYRLQYSYGCVAI